MFILLQVRGSKMLLDSKARSFGSILWLRLWLEDRCLGYGMLRNAKELGMLRNAKEHMEF